MDKEIHRIYGSDKLLEENLPNFLKKAKEIFPKQAVSKSLVQLTDFDLEAIFNKKQNRNQTEQFDPVVDDLVLKTIGEGLKCGCLQCRAEALSIHQWYRK